MQNFLHKRTDDKRSPNEIALSEKLTSKLTELNIKRIQSSTTIKGLHQTVNESSSTKPNQIKNQKILFVCVSGIPPFENEFDNFDLPGQKIKIVLPGFQLDLSEDELRERATKCDLNHLSQEIYQKTQKYPNHFLVFIYHSFGTFITAFYFKNFYEQQKDRIKGIIQLGGAPIRTYKLIEPGLQASLPMSRQFIEENIDFIFGKFNELQSKWKSQSITTLTYRSKYNIMSLFLCYKTKGIETVFDMVRRMPKILKLSIYGEKDGIFEVKHLDQKSIFYLYNSEAALEKNHSSQVTQKYFQLHGQTPKYIQEKFVYKIQNGKHSLHMQKQLTPMIQKMIDQYLRVIF